VHERPFDGKSARADLIWSPAFAWQPFDGKSDGVKPICREMVVRGVATASDDRAHPDKLPRATDPWREVHAWRAPPGKVTAAGSSLSANASRPVTATGGRRPRKPGPPGPLPAGEA